MKNRDAKNVLSITISVLAGAGLIFLTTVLPASADENPKLHFKTMDEYVAGWWRWVEANFLDADGNINFPAGTIDCSEGQSGSVWFLAGATSSDPVERTCDAAIPGQKHLLFPLATGSFFNDPSENFTVAEKREFLDGLLSEEPRGDINSTACRLQVEVGPRSPLELVPAVYRAGNIWRTQSPTFEYRGDPEAVADGYFVVLRPLPRGEYRIHFSSGFCDVDKPLTDDALFEVDVTYDLDVR